MQEDFAYLYFLTVIKFNIKCANKITSIFFILLFNDILHIVLFTQNNNLYKLDLYKLDLHLINLEKFLKEKNYFAYKMQIAY